MVFGYEAFTKEGEKVFGTINADRKEDAAYTLYQKGLIVSQISAAKQEKRMRIKDDELIMFTRLLANAVDAHIPLVRGLEITMEELNPKSILKTIVLSLLYEIKTGKSVSESFQLYPTVFSRFYISMLKSGEKSGRLSAAFSQILNYLIKRYQMAKKLSSAMLYPTFILSFAFVILGFFVLFLIPRFQESYAGFGIEMPALTKGLLAATAFIQKNILWMVGGVAAIVWLVRQWLKSEKGRLLFEKTLFKLPIFGDLYLKDIVARYTRTLSVLLDNGVTLSESLDLLRGIVNNRTYELILEEASERISQGKNLADSLKDKPEIPPILVQMTAMGEESGRLSELMSHLSDFYERDVDTSVEKITSVISPIIIIILGLIIGMIVIGLFLPIFNLSKMMQ